MRFTAIPSVTGSITGASVATRSCRFTMVGVRHTAPTIQVSSTAVTFRPGMFTGQTTPALPQVTAVLAAARATPPVVLLRAAVRITRGLHLQHRRAAIHPAEWAGRRG